MSAIVLDAGALIALERHDRVMWRTVWAAVEDGISVIVPSTVVAQVWRGTARQARLALVLDECEIAPFDVQAHAIGELLGRSHTTDICDAQVALVAAAVADIVYTSDPDDIERLFQAFGRREVAIVRV